MATMLNPNAIPDGSITSAKLDKAYATEENLPPLFKGTGENSVQMNNCTASGLNSFAEGDYTFAIGSNSHAEGYDTYANNPNSHAEGNNTYANGDSSHAEGHGNTASGRFSHVEGSSNQSIGESSHAEGNETEASGDHSHSEGRSTIAKGEDSHAEGCASQANKACSHAEGTGTIADGDYSHSEGLYTKTSNEAEHAEGKYNLSTLGKTIHSVGIGEADDTRMNAFEIFNDGSVLVKGVGGYDGTNGTSAKTIQTVIGEKQDKTAFDSHNNDNTRHITAAERTKWNAKQDALTAGFGISISSGEISSTLDTNPFIVVSSLPSSGVKDKIYIAPSKNPETGNLTDEWIWNGSAWELLGAPKVDLSDYATESWVENKGYLTEHQDISGKADVSYVDNKISTLTNVVNGKQDNISDLTAIRNGATLGSTAIQEETDPTVPAWAKAEKKPSYTPSEIGAASQEALQSHTTDAVVHITSTERANWNAKQDTISDLAAIRSGASKGATALQSYTETDPIYLKDKPNIALKSEIPDISGKVDKVSGKGLSTNDYTDEDKAKLDSLQNYDDSGIVALINNKSDKGHTHTVSQITDFPSIPSKVSELTNDSGFISSIPSEYVTDTELNAKGYLTEHQDISGKANVSDLTAHTGNKDIHVTASDKSKWNAKQDAISDLDDIRAGAAKGATALQSYTEQYKGTVTSVKINGTNKNPSNGVVDLGTVITSHQDISGKQDKLVSGTNIKTINGESILGSGDITITSSGGGSGAYSEVNHGTSDTTFTLTPNTFHVWDEVTSLTLTFGSETSGVANEYLFQFTSGSTATSLTLPNDIKWANGSAPTIGANMIYQVSVLKGLASVLEFNKTKKVPVTPPNLPGGGGGTGN